MNAKKLFPSPPLKEGDLGGGRIQSLDLARGFTVLIMPTIHVVMLYSNPEVQQSLLGNILAFIAEGPGAQLFMLMMGIGIVFSKRNNNRYIIQRALYLLITAYALNAFKFNIPLWLGWLPENLLQELQGTGIQPTATFFLFIGDILHFAAIAFPLTCLVAKSTHYPFLAVILVIAVTLLAPFVWDKQTGIPVIDHLIILFNGHPPQTFFPVFPWLAYPLMGITIGFLLKHYPVKSILKKAGWIGLGVMIITCLFPPTPMQQDWLPFYRTAPADTFFHLGFVCTWIAVAHWISRKVKGNIFFDLLTFCSKHITAIYLIQWILICWGMAIAGYGTLGFTTTFFSMLIITVVTLSLTKLLPYVSRKKSI
ncbi:MAG: DUF1624 domain-containing protein [Sphingobacteriales bacterium]|nr:DUF1624 domain-containing protein [Sphingobacteriales bacterium]OJW01200.1 MAG: hypothetical protein BGO52_07145 [Sphingobacteriales bacterium 44-61]